MAAANAATNTATNIISDANNRFNESPQHEGSKEEWLDCVGDPDFDINILSKDGLKPLHIAALCEPSGEVVEKLLSLGADPNEQASIYKLTPFYLAIRSSHITNLRILLEHGANYYIDDSPKLGTRIALSIAEEYANQECIDFIREVVEGPKTKSANKK